MVFGTGRTVGNFPIPIAQAGPAEIAGAPRRSSLCPSASTSSPKNWVSRVRNSLTESRNGASTSRPVRSLWSTHRRSIESSSSLRDRQALRRLRPRRLPRRRLHQQRHRHPPLARRPPPPSLRLQPYRARRRRPLVRQPPPNLGRAWGLPRPRLLNELPHRQLSSPTRSRPRTSPRPR